MAVILDAFVGKFTEMLVGFTKEGVVMVLGVKDELQKLQTMMLRIQSLLDDAEKKKFEDSAINNWLSELKDVMYDADDIIDLCKIQGKLLADKPYKPETKYMKIGDGLRTRPSTIGSPQVIKEAKGHYGDAKTKLELLPILQDSIGRSLLLVLDDIWMEDMWVDLLRLPLYNANIKVRILVTTRFEDVAKKLGAE